MSDWRTLLLVGRRDFVERLKSRAFQISTALTIVLVLAAVILPQLFDNGPNEWEVGAVDIDPSQLEITMTALQGGTDPVGVNVRTAPSRSDLITLLETGDIDVAVVGGEGVITGDGTSRALATLAAASVTAVELTSRAQQLGLSPGQVASLLGLESPAITSISGEDETEDRGAETLALFATILLFISIVTYGQWILIGVIEEKSNRVVEVVVGTVPPRILLTGKVFGIGLLGLIQLVVIAIVAFAASALDRRRQLAGHNRRRRPGKRILVPRRIRFLRNGLRRGRCLGVAPGGSTKRGIPADPGAHGGIFCGHVLDQRRQPGNPSRFALAALRSHDDAVADRAWEGLHHRYFDLLGPHDLGRLLPLASGGTDLSRRHIAFWRQSSDQRGVAILRRLMIQLS